MRRVTAVLGSLALAGCLRAGFGAQPGADGADDLRAREAASTERVLDGPRADLRDARPETATGRGAFVLYGAGARRLVSFDQGSSWPVDQQDPVISDGTDRWLTGAAWREGVAVLVGGPWGSEGGFALRSDDGTHWTEVAITGSQGPLGLAFGADRFVTINNIGERCTSQDGAAWSCLGGSAAQGRALCFGQGRFFAAGDSGRISTSSDGVSWKTTELGGSTLSAAVCGADRFVAVGEGRRVTTLDGQAVLKDEPVPGLCACGELAFGKGIFVDYACNTSSDGLTWTPGPDGCAMYSIAFGDGVFLGVSKTKDQVMRSADGKTWQALRDRPRNPDVLHVRYVRFP
jgi:hypothetical protein